MVKLIAKARCINNNFDIMYIDGEMMQNVSFNDIKDGGGYVFVQVMWNVTERMDEEELRDWAEEDEEYD